MCIIIMYNFNYKKNMKIVTNHSIYNDSTVQYNIVKYAVVPRKEIR